MQKRESMLCLEDRVVLHRYRYAAVAKRKPLQANAAAGPVQRELRAAEAKERLSEVLRFGSRELLR
jgi:hypothetical protein